MKHFVTGATGFIGRRLCQQLATEGDFVVGITRNVDLVAARRESGLESKNVELITCDVLNQQHLVSAMTGCDTCFHVAGHARQWAPEAECFYSANVTGTERVLQAAVDASVSRFIYTSTAGVLGPSHNGQVLNENSNGRVSAATEYETTKALAEKKVWQYQSSLETVIVNPSRVFGPGPLNESNSLTRIINLVLQGKWRYIPGDGSYVGNYVFVDDVVRGHIVAMQRGRSGERYLLGGENLSFNELFERLKLVTGRKSKSLHVPKHLLTLYARLQLLKTKMFAVPPKLTPEFVNKYCQNYVLSIDKAKQDLGYRPIPIDEALQRTVDWLRTR